ncbi:HAD family hydrolase [Rothia sp. P5764]|uniref:HAD family hydrolase n=1 Tax=Rothia sp. P5764 TaxID=3402654 RepID=UPI003AC963E3
MFEFSLSPDWAPRCAVFDCDGVILDSETTWGQIQGQVFKGWGVDYTPELQASLVGYTAYDVARRLAELSQPAGLTDLGKQEHYQQVLTDLLATERATIEAGVDEIPGAIALIKKLAQHIPVAVASNSTAPVLETKIRAAGLSDVLTTWVSSDDVAKGKPAPDIYLEAVRRLDGRPELTLTLEDSVAGLTAAIAAGTQPLVYLGEPTDKPLLLTAGVGRCDSFTDPQLLAQVERWFSTGLPQ